MVNSVSDQIGIGEAVQALRDELLAAAAARNPQAPVFEVGPIELEFSVALSREGTAKVGSSKLFGWVVSAEAGGKLAKESVHKVRLTLSPRDAGGGPMLISTGAEDAGGSQTSDFDR